MSTDDKFGIGAGLLALGLATGIILLGQLTYNKDTEAVLANAATAASDAADAAMASSDAAEKAAAASKAAEKAAAASKAAEKAAAASKAADKAAAAKSAASAAASLFYRILPHREKVQAEAIFDGIVCVLALPAGICFFVLGTLAGSKDKEAKEADE